MRTARPKRLSTRLTVPALGFLSLGIQPMNAFLVPLWASLLDASPVMLGMAVSAVSILPIFFSISSGALIDRFGSVRVLRFCATFMMLILPLYPLLPAIGALICLQFFYGLAQSMAWICAQALIVKMDKLAGAYAHTKSFSIAGNIGTFIGPLLLGLLWDISGPVGSFLTLATWGMLLFLLSFTLPIDNVEVTNAQQPGLIRSLLPAWTDYRKAFSMLFIPAVFLVMYATCIRLSSTSIRGSFYLVYLQELDFSATKISLLFSSISLVSIFSPLFIRFFSRYTSHYRLLFWSAVMTILPLCLVTLFHQFWPILTISAISGFGLGLTLPLMLSIASKSVDRQDQGLAAGLREMVNRFSAATLPFSFGLFAQSLGLHYAFFVIGLLMIVPMLIIIPFILKRIEAEEHQSSRMAHGVLNK